MSFLRPLESFVGMLQRLLGMLVPCLVILFPVVRGRGSMRVRGELVKFSSSLVGVIWHSVSVHVFESFRIGASRLVIFNATLCRPQMHRGKRCRSR
jgi:hypothetical protein